MRGVLQVLAAILSGMLLLLISPPIGIPWLHWFSFVPMFWALREEQHGKNFTLAYVTGFFGVGSCFFWLTESIIRFSNLGVGIAYLCLALFALAFALPYAVVYTLTHPLRQKYGAWWVVLIPALLVAVEFIGPALFPYYQGVSQYRSPWAFQLTSVTGVTGVSFLILLTNCALAECVYRHREGRPLPFKILGAVAAVFSANLIFGAIRTNKVQAEVAEWPTIRVTQLQQSISMEDRMSGTARAAMLEWYQMTNELAGQDIDLVVWPEGSTPYDPRSARVTTLLGDLAKNMDAPILFGGGFAEKRVDPLTGRNYTEQRNSIYLMSKEGELVQRYDKMVPLPFGEYLPFADTFPILKEWIKGPGDFEAGTVPVQFELEHPTAGTIQMTSPICYEAILNTFVRKNLGESQLFVNVTNDGWFGDTAAPHQHAMLSAVRSVENGVPMIRLAYTGISMHVDPTGYTTNETEPFTRVVRVLTTPVGRIRTIYSIIGDLFSWLCVLVMAGTIIHAIVDWRRLSVTPEKDAA